MVQQDVAQLVHQGKSDSGFSSQIVMENIPDRYFFLPPVDSQQYMGDPVAESVSADHRKIDSRDRVFGGPFSGCFLQRGIGEQLHLFSKDGQDFARVQWKKGSPQVPQQLCGFLDCLFSGKSIVIFAHRDILPRYHPDRRFRYSGMLPQKNPEADPASAGVVPDSFSPRPAR